MNTRLPSWLHQEMPDKAASDLVNEVKCADVHTVCREAHCPNISRCFKNKQLTFLILGDICTRHCLFCAVHKTENKKAGPVDEQEPEKIAAVIRQWDLKYVVVTSVTRDDLIDGGAGQFCRVIKEVRSLGRVKKIEVLIPDLQGSESLIKQIVLAGPDVLGHNIETVRRLYAEVRPEAGFFRSLDVLKFAKECDPDLITKSSLMLGMGENEYDVYAAMEHLRNAKVDILTLGQYLAPSDSHYPVQEYVSPEQFKQYEDIARQFGFRAVLSGPLVRSSFCAEELYNSIAC
jgi:lipoyl synthase